MVLYYGYHFLGMHLIWWFIWVILLFWIFATPYEVPYQRKKKDSPMDILKRRYALGEISNDEYLEKRRLM